MHKTQVFALRAAWAALAVFAIVASQAGAAGAPGGKSPAAAPGDNRLLQEKERAAISVLQSGAPPAKAAACKQLAIYGTKDAVPALAALLPDAQLASWARIALEAIPDPAADEALRDAAGKLQGRLLVGVINSIGVRRDAKAIDLLARRLKGDDVEAASAAAVALGRIGGAAAVEVLEPLLAGGPAEVRPAAAEGCVLCAERFLADGNRAEAVRLYDAVRKADVPQQRRLEAIRGAILARQAAGVPLLVEQLKSPDKALFRIGLSTARELPGGEATDALVALMGETTPDRQALLLLALADRGDAKALPAVVKAAASGPIQARTAAMGALERIGNASCVPVLLDVMLSGDAQMAQMARATLAKLPGPDVDAGLAASLPQAKGKVRQAVIELAGQRRVVAALPAIVGCVEDADAGVRTAAVDAIGALGEARHAADLVRAIQKTGDVQEQAGIEKALMAISGRAGAACAAHLMPLARSDDRALRVIALHALATAGGPDALAAVKSAVDDKEETVQDEAVRTLSTWPSRWPDDAAVTAPLLAVARSAKKPQHQVLAIRGLLQYVQGAKNLQDAERLARVKDVLPLVARPEEKRIVISVLGGIAAAGSLDALATLAADPAVAEEACAAIVNLAASTGGTSIPADQRRKSLQTVLDKSKSDATKKKADDAMKAIR